MKGTGALAAALVAMAVGASLPSLAVPGLESAAAGLWRWTEGAPVASTDAAAAATLSGGPGAWVLGLPGQLTVACAEGAGRLLLAGAEAAAGTCSLRAAAAPVDTVAAVRFDGRWVARFCDAPFVRLACDASAANRQLPVHDRVAGEGLFPSRWAAAADHAPVAAGGTVAPWEGSWSWRLEGHEAAFGLRPASLALSWVEYSDGHVDWAWRADEAFPGQAVRCVRDHRVPGASPGAGGLALWQHAAGGLAGTGACEASFPEEAAPWALARLSALVEPIPPCFVPASCPLVPSPASPARLAGEGRFAGPSWAEAGP